ncbi:cyclic-di-AMP receptor [Deinococcus sp.]|uniref:cyclic-di-AMP receptor n=1 Tax=Deinococcus sp. TaxID=47478 RepID=UPI0025C43961|nr:cyclic-di-AMP receptor [Deinococcus sp.]
MKLVLAVIQDADASALIRALSQHSFEVTKLASTGGFLREGNTTLMIGVDDERLPDLKQHIQNICHARTRLMSPSVPISEQNEGLVSEPVEVPVGGAVLFVLGVQEFIKV